MVSLGPPTGWTPAATPGDPGHAAAPAPATTAPTPATTAPAPAAAAPAPATEWRSEGSVLLGLDLVRSVFDATGAPTAQVKAKTPTTTTLRRCRSAGRFLSAIEYH